MVVFSTSRNVSTTCSTPSNSYDVSNNKMIMNNSNKNDDNENFALSYLRIVELNNQGAALSSLAVCGSNSCEANIQASGSLFREAVQNAALLLNQLESKRELDGEEETSSLDSTTTFSSIPSVNHLLLSLGNNSCKQELTSGAMQTNNTSGAAWDCAFLQPLFVTPEVYAYSNDKLTNISIVMSIVVFNLGVSFHRLGSFGCQDNAMVYTRHHLKAQSLYRKSQLLVRQIATVGSLRQGHDGAAVLDLLLLASQNNIAHMSYVIGDYEAFRDHSRQLYVCAALQTNFSQYDADTRSILVHYKDQFVHTAICLQPPTHAASA